MITLNQVYKLPRTILIFNFVRAYIIFFIGILPLLFLGSDLKILLALGGLLFILSTIIYVLLYLDYINFSLVIGEKGITVNSGILIKHSKVISFSSIQTVEYSLNPVSYILGVVLVKIWTGSAGQFNLNGQNNSNYPELSFYITPDEAKWLKEYVAQSKSV